MTSATQLRVPRNSLNRRRVVECALELLDTEGLSGVTIRAVASRLGATPMALYTHVPNKSELMAAVREALWSEVPLPDTHGVEGLVSLWMGMWRVSVAHPHAVPLIVSQGEESPASLRVAEHGYRLALDLGLAARDALLLHAALSRYVIGCTVRSSGHEAVEGPAAASALQERVKAVAGSRYPALNEVTDALAGLTQEDVAAYGLHALIDEAVRRAQQGEPPRARVPS